MQAIWVKEIHGKHCEEKVEYRYTHVSVFVSIE